MYLYKTQLTEAQIEAYEQPEGTRNPECGGGINCAFCALKMLDVYNREFAEKGTNMCMPRYRSGDIIRSDEHLTAIQGIIKDVYGEDHVFKIQHFPGNPNEILTKIASELAPSEACYLVYGNSAPDKGTHAVVFRRAEDGVLEMIDPQRGRKDEGTRYGITGRYAKELDDLGGRVDVTDNYYRVRGERAIAFAMQAQSVAFGYWATKEEFDAEFARNPAVFTIGTLLIDSMIKTAKMELDEPPPKPSPMKMEVEGGGPPIPVTPSRVLTVHGLLGSKQVSQFVSHSDVETETEAEAELESEEYTWPDEKDVVSDDMMRVYYVIAKALSPRNADMNGDILTRLFEMTYSEEDENEDEEYIQDKDVGYIEDDGPFSGGAKKRKESEIESALRSKDLVEKSSFVFNEANILRKTPRDVFEDTFTPIQCSGVTSLTKRPPHSKNNCWLCMSPTNVFGGARKQQWPNIKIGRRHFNRAECEHLIPAETMAYMGVLYSQNRTDYSHPDLMRELYDNSCNPCNNQKDKHFYIKTATIDGPYIPNALVIFKDVISFFTFIGKGSSGIVYDGGLIKDKLPADIQQYGSIVEVGTKTPPAYYPNVIRATFDPMFPSGKGGGGLGWYAAHSDEIKKMRPTDIPTKFSSDKNYSPAVADLVKLFASGKEFDYKASSDIVLDKLVRNSVVVGQYTSPRDDEYSPVDTPNIRKVNQRIAIYWVLDRFCKIYQRMQTICDMLNKDDILRAVYNRIPEVIETEGQHEEEAGQEASAPPPAKRRRRGGHIDISVHRGGRRVIEVDYV